MESKAILTAYSNGTLETPIKFATRTRFLAWGGTTAGDTTTFFGALSSDTHAVGLCVCAVDRGLVCLLVRSTCLSSMVVGFARRVCYSDQAARGPSAVPTARRCCSAAGCALRAATAATLLPPCAASSHAPAAPPPASRQPRICGWHPIHSAADAMAAPPHRSSQRSR